MTDSLTPSPEPLCLTIKGVTRVTDESKSQVEDLLRQGIYTAKKAGRRTLVDFESVKRRYESLPPAIFAPPRKRGASNV